MGEAGQMLMPKACVNVVSREGGKKGTCFVFFFFFLMKYNLMHNVLNYQRLTLCVASSTLNIISLCSLA